MNQVYTTYIRLCVLSVGLLGSFSFVQALLLTPDNSELWFDVDDVLVELEKGIKSKLVRHMVVRPPLWKEIPKLRKFSAYAEKLIKKHKNTRFSKLISRVKYGKIPVKGMTLLVQELKNRGYTLRILSNMERADFEFYRKKYPEIFDCFDGEVVVEQKQSIKKPDPEYFGLSRKRYPTNKYIFFIDDKEKNCQACGFAYTHVFKDAKTLRAALREHGIL